MRVSAAEHILYCLWAARGPANCHRVMLLKICVYTVVFLRI